MSLTTEEKTKEIRRSAFYAGSRDKTLSELLAEANKLKSHPEIKSTMTSTIRTLDKRKSVKLMTKREKIINLGKNVFLLKDKNFKNNYIMKELDISLTQLTYSLKLYKDSLI